MSMSETFSVPFYTLIKPCYAKTLEWSSLVPGPKVKWPLEIMNLTPFTVSYHLGGSSGIQRWQRNTMGRPLSPPQFHHKINWMLSNFHKTTSKHWQRTPGTQRGSLFSLKGDRTIYKRQKKKKELGTETCPGEGIMKEEKVPYSRKPSHSKVCGEFWNLRGQHKIQTIQYTPKCNCGKITLQQKALT